MIFRAGALDYNASARRGTGPRLWKNPPGEPKMASASRGDATRQSTLGTPVDPGFTPRHGEVGAAVAAQVLALA